MPQEELPETEEETWTKDVAGWWFGTFLIFPYVGNNHPID